MNKLLVTLLILLPLAGLAAAVDISEGTWNDGTSIQWICKPGTNGAVLFKLTLPTGQFYQGQLSCGEGV